MRAVLPALISLVGLTLSLAGPPEPPLLGEPGDRIFTATVALTHPKKSEDRAQGGPNHMFFSVWVPEGLESVRGIYHTPLNLDTVEKAHSRAMAANWGFALVGANYMRVSKEDFVPSLKTGLKELAEKSGRPELETAPMIVSGMSAGAGMARTLAELMPERVIACGLVCLEVGPDTPATRGVPMMTIFGEKDGQQMPKLMEKLPLRRGEFDASWAIAPQWGRRHEWGKANHLLWTFFDEVLRQRLPDGATALQPCDPAHAWLADPAAWTERAATIAPLATFPGDKAAACWLPGEETARVWQAFVVKKPLVRIVSPEPQGDGKPLAIFRIGESVTVEVKCESSLPAEEMTLHDRAKEIASTDIRNGTATFNLKFNHPGFHTLIAKPVIDGKTELSHPVTILVQP